jgi:hypothetical protein
MKIYGGVDVFTHIFLTSALVGGQWSASRPGRFTPGERAPATHLIGGWVGPRAGSDDICIYLFSDILNRFDFISSSGRIIRDNDWREMWGNAFLS